MLGSSDSAAEPNTTINAIVAEAFCEAADRLEKADDFDMAVHDLIKEYLTEHRRVIFNGNGYSQSWVKEAERRGLPNLETMVDAVDSLLSKDSVKMYEKFKIFTKAELESRAEVLYDKYSKTVCIEARTMVDMAKKQIIPAVMKYTGELADKALLVEKAGGRADVHTALLKDITSLLCETQDMVEKLEKDLETANGMKVAKKKAFFYKDNIMADMESLRVPADKLETLVDKSIWPFPTYGDLLFEV